MAISRAHYAPLPPGFITVRILQFLFTVITLSLSVFMIIERRNNRPDLNWASPYIVMGTAAATLVVLIWIILACYVTPRAYNYWALLATEILFLGAWADGFVSAVGSTFKPGSGCLYIYNDSTHTVERHCKDTYHETRYRAASYSSWVVLGLAGSLLVLWLVSLIVVSVSIARHRRAGGHCKPERF